MLGDLPNEVILRILRFLPLRDACSFALVARRYSALLLENLLWKWRCKRDFHVCKVPPRFLASGEYPWLRLYKHIVRWEKGVPSKEILLLMENVPDVEKSLGLVRSLQLWGELLMLGCSKGIQMWNVDGHCLLATIQGFQNTVNCVLVDDEKIVTASDTRVRFFDRSTFTLYDELIGHTQNIFTIAETERLFISAGYDSSIRLWDKSGICSPADSSSFVARPTTSKSRTNDTRLLAVLSAHRGIIHFAVNRESDGGHTLVTGGEEARLRIWDLEAQKNIATLEGHEESIEWVQFDAQKIASCSFDRTVRLWDRRTATATHVLKQHTHHVCALQYDDWKLVSCGKDGLTVLWDWRTLPKPLAVHAVTGGCHWCLAFDECRIAVGSQEGGATLYYYDTAERPNPHADSGFVEVKFGS